MNSAPRRKPRTFRFKRYPVPKYIKDALATLKPPDDITVSQWAERNRILSRKESNLQGYWRNSVTPYLTGIMDEFNNWETEQIIFVKPTQCGGTEGELNMLGYVIDQDPAPVLIVYPNDELAESTSANRISSMMETPCLKRHYMTDGKAVEIRTEDGRVVVGPGALELISSWEWLQEANRNARRGKRTRPSIMQYQDDLEHNLIQTGEEMRAGTYRTGPYRRLWVYIPKRRLVMALDYRDRVVQWSVYQLLYPYFDRRMIEDSYACRRGRGSHKAVARLQYWLRQIDRKPNGKEWYYLKIDVSKYFYRVDHDVLLRILRRHIADPGLLDLLAGIINNPDEPFGLPPGMKPEDADFEAWLYDVGMPIGNLPSQLFGNVVLNELDQFVKHRLKARKYERYMDDGLFLSDSKETLNAWKQAVGDYLRQELHLDLNDKTAIRPVTMGIEFVGRRVWATHSRLRKSTVRRLKNEVHGICRQRAAGTLSKAGFERRCASI